MDDMTLKTWLTNNAQGLVELLESLDDEELMDWNPGFAARHKAWKRERAEQKYRDGVERRLAQVRF